MGQGYVTFLQPLPRLSLKDLPFLVPCDPVRSTTYGVLPYMYHVERFRGWHQTPRLGDHSESISENYLLCIYTLLNSKFDRIEEELHSTRHGDNLQAIHMDRETKRVNRLWYVPFKPHGLLPRYCGSRARQNAQSGPFPVFPLWLRCSVPLTSVSSCRNPSKGEKAWLAARGPYHHRPQYEVVMDSCFIRPGVLGVDLGCFLCDTARMARLIAALVFKLIPSFCRRLFLCSAGGDLIARSYFGVRL